MQNRNEINNLPRKLFDIIGNREISNEERTRLALETINAITAIKTRVIARQNTYSEDVEMIMNINHDLDTVYTLGRDETALSCAASHNDVEIVRALIKAGASVDPASLSDTWSALSRALWQDHGESAKILLDAGAKVTRNIALDTIGNKKLSTVNLIIDRIDILDYSKQLYSALFNLRRLSGKYQDQRQPELFNLLTALCKRHEKFVSEGSIYNPEKSCPLSADQYAMAKDYLTKLTSLRNHYQQKNIEYMDYALGKSMPKEILRLISSYEREVLDQLPYFIPDEIDYFLPDTKQDNIAADCAIATGLNMFFTDNLTFFAADRLPNGYYIASLNSRLKIFDIDSATLVAEIQVPGKNNRITSFMSLPDQQVIFCDEHQLRLFKYNDKFEIGKQVKDINNACVGAKILLPLANKGYVTAGNRVIEVRDAELKSLVSAKLANNNGFTSVVVLRDGTILASGSRGYLNHYQSDLTLISKIKIGNYRDELDLSLLDKNNKYAVVYTRDTIRLFDLTSNTVLSSIKSTSCITHGVTLTEQYYLTLNYQLTSPDTKEGTYYLHLWKIDNNKIKLFGKTPIDIPSVTIDSLHHINKDATSLKVAENGDVIVGIAGCVRVYQFKVGKLLTDTFNLMTHDVLPKTLKLTDEPANLILQYMGFGDTFFKSLAKPVSISMLEGEPNAKRAKI